MIKVAMQYKDKPGPLKFAHLFKNAITVDEILKFLEKTEIATRNWLQNQGKTEEEGVDEGIEKGKEWRTRKRGSITSVLALDIKNAYPTVRAALFAKICIWMKLPTELIKWFINFISDRTIRFAFDNKISAIIGINDGIPQGSPVSPIIFLIFIQHVIGTLEHKNEIITLNYADDLAMVTELSCARTNSIRLQLALRQLVKATNEIQI
jgi:hypothetical protein